MKAKASVDHLAENPINEKYEPLKTYFLDEEVHGDLIHFPPSELHTMTALWPFVSWGMDEIRRIKPNASNGYRFILVAIDYFIKWVEATIFKSVTKKAVVDFVHSNNICRFYIPKIIVMNNAANLNCHLMYEVCQQFKIMHRNLNPYRSKANGAVKAANKNLKKILRKMEQGATPYSLVYGTKAVIPAEIEIPSLQVVVEAKIDDDQWVKNRLE
ncbi:uncharacterized protein LOC107852670 [Capsicum annuum]|uniref:uncharacterized protein LOC107852670 n=1 Tax=Capsicum annuum TaxID=4072 RepID=UPI0007BF7AA0|nr:uncharacterized protein LOC107852670 [Capsicum annuum]